MTRKLIKDHTKEILELYKQGLSDNQIAQRSGFGSTGISNFLRKEGLDSNHSKSVNYYERCEQCISAGKYKKCQECYNKADRERSRSSVIAYLKFKFNAVKKKCRQRNIEFNLTIDNFIEIYNNQKGKCFYSDEIMTYQEVNGRYAISIDRVMSSGAYEPNNIVFCCFCINTCKSDLTLEQLREWFPPWYERIQAHLPKVNIP